MSAFLTGSLVLWHGVENAVLPYGMVVAHATRDIDCIGIDERIDPITRWTGEPIVCDLRAGDHVLRGWQEEQRVYEETFTIGRGECVVLYVWAPRPKEK